MHIRYQVLILHYRSYTNAHIAQIMDLNPHTVGIYVNSYKAICKTWFPKGHQRIIPTYGKHEGVKLLGTINYETGEIYCEEHNKYDAVVFENFLKNVIKRYPKGKIVFLPPYSPQMNIIEGLWGWMKDEVINNAFFSNVQEIREAVQWFINWVNQMPKTVIDRLCVRM